MSIPNLGFHKVTIEPVDLQQLKGNPRVKLLLVTSPGITNIERIRLRKSFTTDPKNPAFDITGDSSMLMLENKARSGGDGLDIEFLKRFDR